MATNPPAQVLEALKDFGMPSDKFTIRRIQSVYALATTTAVEAAAFGLLATELGHLFMKEHGIQSPLESKALLLWMSKR